MNLIYNKIFLKHKTESHPECPERLAYFDKQTKQTKIENGKKYLSLIYDKSYIHTIQEASRNERLLDADTYTNKYSFEVACYAVGAAIKAAKQSDFALTRPPGHHATKGKAMGFCLFNNIAIASEYMVKEGKKVFIVDFDAHHGNGTQDIFYKTDQVLYLSTHLFPYYPGTGWFNEIGEDKGKGFTINIPLPPGTADDLFLESLNYFIPLIKEQFDPDIVAVSAGFDSHHSDTLTNLNLTMNSFYKTGKLLSKNFKNIFACLEGGYNLDILHKNILSFVNGINKKENEFKEQPTETEETVKEEFNKRFEQLKQELKPYWNIQ